MSRPRGRSCRPARRGPWRSRVAEQYGGALTASPASHPFRIEEHDADGVHVIAVSGELDLATAPRLCVLISAARARGVRRVLVDLSATTFCDSCGLRALIGEDRELKAHGGRMGVVCPSGEGPVPRLFEMTGAHELLAIRDSADAGLDALA
ncbi:MAG TPA: STAS domain-containing protein [Solirubrobacteraceae bacterium]|nr:STAS domain-containing protein [Solirubrobacteraceae bacterium]